MSLAAIKSAASFAALGGATLAGCGALQAPSPMVAGADVVFQVDSRTTGELALVVVNVVLAMANSIHAAILGKRAKQLTPPETPHRPGKRGKRKAAKMQGLLLVVLLLWSPWSAFAEIDVCFSPGGACESRAVEIIAQATNEVRVLAYVFTSEALGRALMRAQERGVSVAMVLDSRSNSRSGIVKRLRDSGVSVRYDAKHCAMHHKVIIVDRATLICGSFNYSRNAENCNAENMLIITREKVIREFEGAYILHERHSGD